MGAFLFSHFRVTNVLIVDKKLTKLINEKNYLNITV